MAGDLEGRPFHLVATHCQRGERNAVVDYIRGKGLAEDTPNVTVTSFGGHPGVEGNGYVPYYMVFDHTGKLRRQHMCGDYHGGDGLEMIEWVHRLLDETPDIWLGPTPYVELEDLARKVESGKGLGAVAKTLEAEASDPEAAAEGARREEAERLYAALTAWRDRQVANAERLLATTPDEVVDRLEDLHKELRGSALATAVEEKIEALEDSEELDAALDLQKDLEKAQRKIERLRVPREAKRRGVEIFSLTDPDCREAHEKTLRRTAEKLREAVEGHEALPITATILAYVARLEGA